VIFGIIGMSKKWILSQKSLISQQSQFRQMSSEQNPERSVASDVDQGTGGWQTKYLLKIK
jgi:hypothetical protein